MNLLLSPPKITPQDQPHRRRWTREEYYRMEEMGFFVGQRVELLWGEVIQMPAMKTPHMASIELTERALEAAFGSNYWVRVQGPLHLPDDSEPEPDLAVVPGGPRDFPDDHPTTALLVVEISYATLDFDRDVKGPMYASANLPEYWIVNLIDRRLEVHRDPKPDPVDPQRSHYGQVLFVHPDDAVMPLALPKSSIKVSDLLP
jgi:Uma2 family endonuclease